MANKRVRRKLDWLSGIKHPKKRALLRAIAYNAWTIEQATRATGVGRVTHYYWLMHDEAYRAAFEKAKELRDERLEEAAIERATREKEPSDTLLIFLLKGAMPHKYKERVAQEVSGSGGGPVQVVVSSLDPAVYGADPDVGGTD